MSTLKVGGIRGVSASSDAITVANDGTASANLTSVGGAPLSNRNKVINGAMQVSQRGTSFSCNTTEIYTIDRFKTEMGSSFDFDTTITQENDTPDGFQKSLKVTPDATKSVSGSHNAGIYTLLEGQDLQDFKSGTSGAKKIVYSFFAKSGSSNNGHQYSVFVRLRNGSNYYKQVRAFTVTSSWQRFSFAFDLDTSTNQIGTASADACMFGCFLVCGPDDLIAETTSWVGTSSTFLGATGQSNFMDNTSNEFFITGVQLEISDSGVASDFEHRSFAQELKLCSRYYQKQLSGNPKAVATGFAYNTQYGNFTPHYPMGAMRTAPSLDQTNGNNYYEINGGLDHGDHLDGAFIIEHGTETTCNIYFDPDAALNNGYAFYIRSDNAAAYFAYSAEL